ncbi:hypothetical protein [uncultured Megasphaera sp.]|uniref:hypothetical protein n=1 Tax=uncultured Megasphaera sp. TaxID=165188 RepID=UPI0025FD3BFD|nr:hypothetical protein [uncultured Megasphaera sp.]
MKNPHLESIKMTELHVFEAIFLGRAKTFPRPSRAYRALEKEELPFIISIDETTE